MFYPYFIITDGESGSPSGGVYKIPHQWFTGNTNPKYREKPINPYRDFRAGGTSFGFRGKNYWISDKTFLGKVLRKVYGS